MIEIIVTSVASIVVALFGSKWFNDRTIKRAVKLKLTNHNIFTTIDDVRMDVKMVEFFLDEDINVRDVTKEKMFVCFMNNKLDSIKTETLRFLGNEEDLLNLTKTELSNKMLGLMNNIILDYSAVTKQDFLEKGVKNEDVVYIINLFEEWRFDTVKAMKIRIQSLFSSEFHTTNHSIVLGLLEVFSFSILLIPKDGIQSFKSFNGRFSKVNF